jgi:hypothetical protein
MGSVGPLPGVFSVLLLLLVVVLLLPWSHQQVADHPALPHSMVAVGHPARDALRPQNASTSFVLPCIHEEHEFAHRRQYLLRPMPLLRTF